MDHSTSCSTGALLVNFLLGTRFRGLDLRPSLTLALPLCHVCLRPQGLCCQTPTRPSSGEGPGMVQLLK